MRWIRLTLVITSEVIPSAIVSSTPVSSERNGRTAETGAAPRRTRPRTPRAEHRGGRQPDEQDRPPSTAGVTAPRRPAGGPVSPTVRVRGLLHGCRAAAAGSFSRRRGELSLLPASVRQGGPVGLALQDRGERVGQVAAANGRLPVSIRRGHSRRPRYRSACRRRGPGPVRGSCRRRCRRSIPSRVPRAGRSASASSAARPSGAAYQVGQSEVEHLHERRPA